MKNLINDYTRNVIYINSQKCFIPVEDKHRNHRITLCVRNGLSEFLGKCNILRLRFFKRTVPLLNISPPEIEEKERNETISDVVYSQLGKEKKNVARKLLTVFSRNGRFYSYSSDVAVLGIKLLIPRVQFSNTFSELKYSSKKRKKKETVNTFLNQNNNNNNENSV